MLGFFGWLYPCGMICSLRVQTAQNGAAYLLLASFGPGNTLLIGVLLTHSLSFAETIPPIRDAAPGLPHRPGANHFFRSIRWLNCQEDPLRFGPAPQNSQRPHESVINPPGQPILLFQRRLGKSLLLLLCQNPRLPLDLCSSDFAVEGAGRQRYSRRVANAFYLARLGEGIDIDRPAHFSEPDRRPHRLARLAEGGQADIFRFAQLAEYHCLREPFSLDRFPV